MSNIASALRDEITRLARKEIKSDTSVLAVHQPNTDATLPS